MRTQSQFWLISTELGDMQGGPGSMQVQWSVPALGPHNLDSYWSVSIGENCQDVRSGHGLPQIGDQGC